MGDTIPWDAEIYPLLFTGAGVLLAAGMPRRPVGWLMLFVGACFAGNALSLQVLAATDGPADASGSSWLAWWAERGSAVLVPATLLLVLLLPDGRLPSRIWRPVAAVVAGVQLLTVLIGSLVGGPIEVDDPVGARFDNPVGLLPDGWSGLVDSVVGPVLVLPFLLGVVAVGQRLRHPAGDERPRVLLVLVGALLFALLLTVPDLAWPGSTTWFHVAGVAVLTGTVTVSALRGQLAPVRVLAGPAVSREPVGAAEQVPPAAAVEQPAVDRSVAALLSPREREIMDHLARGLTNAEIAAALVISPITVRNHVSSILTKLDASNRTQAVARFLGQG